VWDTQGTNPASLWCGVVQEVQDDDTDTVTTGEVLMTRSLQTVENQGTVIREIGSRDPRTLTTATIVGAYPGGFVVEIQYSNERLMLPFSQIDHWEVI